MTDFQGFPKIARMFRDMVITEKIDGTNGAIGIEQIDEEAMRDWCPLPGAPYALLAVGEVETSEDGVVGQRYKVYAQSRSRIIYPGMDNHGFAKWVWENAESLIRDLGPGLHFGEWWGSGINRGYGLSKGEKRFSLFNTKRWAIGPELQPYLFETPGLGVVPVLYTGPFSTGEIRVQLETLEAFGSVASPGFMNPEGVVVYHTAGNTMFKATIHGDEKPKSMVPPLKGETIRTDITDPIPELGARGAGMGFDEYLAKEGLVLVYSP